MTRAKRIQGDGGIARVAEDGLRRGQGRSALTRSDTLGAMSEIETLRSELIGYLRVRFRNALSEEDFEDLAQEAWETVLRKGQRGERIDDLLGFTRTVAWRDARDLIRDRRESAVDPTDRVFAAIADGAAAPDERLGRRIDLVRAIEAVEQLSSEHRAAYRVRFFEQLSTAEACERLGLARSTYHHRLRRAVETVQANLEGDRFRGLQLKLLGAYVAGVATLNERRRAERLIRTDPQAAVAVRELRAAHERTAAALTPIGADPEASAGIVERLAALPGRIRESLPGGGTRAPELSEAATSASTLATGTRGTGVVAGGALAKLAGIGGAGKLAVACLGTGAAATACVAAGLVPGVGPGSAEEKPDPASNPGEKISKVAREVPAPASAPEKSRPIVEPPVNSEPAPRPAPEPEPEPVSPEPTETAAPTAPPSEQEFGVPAATETAPAPASGETSSRSGGGSAVQQEFGP